MTIQTLKPTKTNGGYTKEQARDILDVWRARKEYRKGQTISWNCKTKPKGL